MSFSNGMRIGSYEIIASLGAGGMGEVSRDQRRIGVMDKVHTDRPVLNWETLNTKREEDGILKSKYRPERAKCPEAGL